MISKKGQTWNTNNETVLITGTSSGFGRRTAQTLAERGYHVFASMRAIEGKNADAARTMREWAGAQDASLEVLELDITDQQTVDDAVAHILESAGRIDVVVNNAASGTIGLIETFSVEEVRESFETLVLGPLRVDKAVLPTMRKQGSGLLVHLSSTAGRIPAPFLSPYSAGKAALEVFAEGLSFELAPLGVDSIIVQPGGFPTEGVVGGSFMTTPADQQLAAEYGELATKPQEMFEGIADLLDGADASDPQDVVDAIADLIELPAGRRPLRTVVGTMGTAGVRELNEAYERGREQMMASMGMG